MFSNSCPSQPAWQPSQGANVDLPPSTGLHRSMDFHGRGWSPALDSELNDINQECRFRKCEFVGKHDTFRLFREMILPWVWSTWSDLYSNGPITQGDGSIKRCQLLSCSAQKRTGLPVDGAEPVEMKSGIWSWAKHLKKSFIGDVNDVYH